VIPGEYVLRGEAIDQTPAVTVPIRVENTGDRPIQVGSYT
jgi:urease beta subunit